jgi:predicted O-methyltransferase YrrM
MRSFRHWTSAYIRDRLTLAVREYRRPNDPWLTAPAVELLSSWLRPSDVGLELGSGRSTLWFAARVAHLISVEHDEAWFRRISGQLHERGLATRTDYRLCTDGKNGDPASSYVGVVSSLDAESLDFVLIDGVARDHCALAALDKLKPGALLVIDNINWFYARPEPSRAPNSRSLADGFESAEWARLSAKLDAWRVIWTTDGVCDTALWVKPAR